MIRFFITASSQGLLSSFFSTFLRFPIPITILTALYLRCLISYPERDFYRIINELFAVKANDILLILLAFAASCGIVVMGEVRGKTLAWKLAVCLLAILLTAIVYWFSDLLSLLPAFILPGCVLLAATMPFIGTRANPDAVWFFLVRLAFAVFVGFVLCLVTIVGISALVASVKILFELDLYSNTIDMVHKFVWIIFGPVFVLYLVPQDFEKTINFEDKTTLINRLLSVTVNFLLSSLTVIFTLLLHAYALKIAIFGELPKGEVATSVLSFGGLCVTLAIIAYPWREHGSRVTRWLIAIWPFLMIVPIILLGYAIFERISEYGVTPERYWLFLVLVWFVILVIVLAVKRKALEPNVVIFCLCLLLLLGGMGPWGARAVTRQSQYAQLNTLLEKVGVMENGRLKAHAQMPTTRDRKAINRIFSIVNVLGRQNDLDVLRPLFEGRQQKPFTDGGLVQLDTMGPASTIASELAPAYQPEQKPLTVFGLEAMEEEYTVVKGRTRIVGPVILSHSNGNVHKPAAHFKARIVDHETIEVEYKNLSWTISAAEVKRLTDLQHDYKHKRAFVISLQSPAPATFMFTKTHGSVTDKGARLIDVTFWAFLPD